MQNIITCDALELAFWVSYTEPEEQFFGVGSTSLPQFMRHWSGLVSCINCINDSSPHSNSFRVCTRCIFTSRTLKKPQKSQE